MLLHKHRTANLPNIYAIYEAQNADNARTLGWKYGNFVCLFVCMTVTALTKKTVDGFVPHFMERLGGKGRHCKFEFRYDR